MSSELIAGIGASVELVPHGGAPRSTRTFNSIAKKLHKTTSYSALIDYAGSPAFVRDLADLPNHARVNVFVLYAKAVNRLNTSTAPAGGVKWHADNIARLRRLAGRYSNDEDLARAMGMRKNQVRMARHRFLGALATTDQRKAA
jgi:hypothetical protein